MQRFWDIPYTYNRKEKNILIKLIVNREIQQKNIELPEQSYEK